jgi:Kef-type K+ transport system membrane component KefB
MQSNIFQLLLMLFISTLLGWLTKTFFYTSFIGYIAGGIVTSVLFTALGLGVSEASQLEVLKSIGLTIFFFEMGLSIDLARLLKSLDKVLVIELTAYPLLWIAAKIVGGFMGLNIASEAVLFLMLIDCSSASIPLALSLRNPELRSLAIIESNLEDLALFILFSTLFTAQATSPTLIGVGVSVMKIVTLLVVMGYALNAVIRRFRGFIQRLDTLSRYLLLLSIALLYSVVAQQMGLPPFLGAFVAGVVVSQFMGSSSEELSLLSGVRELGLLLYFSSLGTQLVLIFMDAGSPSIIIDGVVVGIAGVIARFLSLLIGLVMSGANPGHILPYATALSSISETSVILVDTLATQGGLAHVFKALVLTGVVTSIVISSLLYRRSHEVPAVMALILPQKAVEMLSKLSNLLIHTASAVVDIGRSGVRFLATLLITTYLIHITTVATKYLPQLLSLATLTSVTILSYIVIVREFVRFLRKSFEKTLSAVEAVKGLREAVLRLATSIVTLLTVAILLATFHTIVTEANMPTPLSYALIATINTVTIAILVLIAITRIRKGIKRFIVERQTQTHQQSR